MGLGHLAEKSGVGRGAGTDDDAAGTGRVSGLGEGAVAHATTKLNLRAELGDASECREVERGAAEGTVEVNDVNPFRAGLGELDGWFDGVFVIVRPRVVAALAEAYAATAADVDGGIDDHEIRRPCGPSYSPRSRSPASRRGWLLPSP